MNLRGTPIRIKLRLVILVTCAVAMVVACATLFGIQYYVFRQEQRDSLHSVAGMIAKSVAPAVSFENTRRGDAIMEGLAVKPDIINAQLILPNRVLFSEYRTGYKSFLDRPLVRKIESWTEGSHDIYAQPVELDGEFLGTLYIVSNYGVQASRLINLYLAIFCGVLTLSVLVSLLSSVRLGRVVTRSLENLAATVRTIAGSNDYSVRAEKEADDEVGALTDSFNEMIARVQSRDAALRHEIIERERAEQALQALHAQLVDASRQAGMAEVATGVLHNVGNVLNSVNVSATLVAEKLNIQRLNNLQRTAEMLHSQNGGLANFLTDDPKGQLIPGYLENLARHLVSEQQQALTELELLTKNIEHIKEIVSMQQTFARVAGFAEQVSPEVLIEDALRMTTGSLQRHQVDVVRDYAECPPVQVERHKVLQILVNLIRNAKHSLDEARPPTKTLSLILAKTSEGFASITVQDNGSGILENNLTKIFSHGFTTRKDGHGFGLHSAALAAQQMNGRIRAHSPGAGARGEFYAGTTTGPSRESPMMAASHYRILIVDDNPAIHEDFRKILLGQRAGLAELDAAEAILFENVKVTPREPRANFTIDSAHQGHEALAMVQQALAEGQPYAMAFVDVRMPPGWDGIETIDRLWRVAPMLQVVVCTAYSDYSWDKMTEKLGVSDNLVLLKKPFDNLEVLQLSHALTKKWLVTGQAQLRLDELEQMVAARTRELGAAYEELRTSEERFAQAFRNNPIPQAIQTIRAQRFVDVNEAFLAMTGFSRNECVGRTPLELRFCLDYESRFLAAAREGRVIHETEATISTRSGELRQTLLSLEPMTLAGEPHVLLMMQDITERLTLETQLRQAQKMEAVGQLAAGVAHDFNNLLTIIQGHASLHLDRGQAPASVNVSLHQINGAAERAADLTRKLLTFSRRGMVRPKALNLGEVIQSLSRMLRRVLSEKITLAIELPPNAPNILADSTSIEQVLMNLTLNARDAMPEGGTITIATALAEFATADRDRHPEARAGRFLHLIVADNGTGMDSITRDHIFEPFFTTKGLNKGTGMGLATVYGIVKQHEGWIEVETALGKGSSFHVYLPVTDSAADAAQAPAQVATSDAGQHTIFVVEDDAAVRALVVEVLASFQYNVIEAENGDTAIAMWARIQDQVDLLLTDMVMPGQANGLEVARHCLSVNPKLRVIYTSGYSSELFGSNVKLEEGVNYLPKPYLSSKLTAIIRHALEHGTTPAADAPASK